MNRLLIYLVISADIFILTDILFTQTVPFLINSHQRWQERRGAQIADQLEVSFIFMEKKKELFLTLFPFIFAGLGFLIVRNIVSLAIGFLFGLAVPGFIIKIAWYQRVKKFQGQLVDSIMILSSCLKAGLSFMQAIEVLCEEMPPPISQEFGLVLKENKLGLSLEESLRILRKKIPIEEVNLLVSSILVAKETGGELTKVFTRLTETIRDNLKLKEKVATLTLQGRLQGIIMAFLPIGFCWFIYKQNPNHFDIMFETQIGKTLLVGAVVGQLLGMYLIKKISTIRV